MKFDHQCGGQNASDPPRGTKDFLSRLLRPLGCLSISHLANDCPQPKGDTLPTSSGTTHIQWLIGLDSESCSVVSNSLRSMEFSRPEYWSGQLFPSSKDLPNRGTEPRSPPSQTDSLLTEPPGKPRNTGVGSLSLPQRIFPTQEWTQGLLHCRQMLYQQSYQGSSIWRKTVKASLPHINSRQFGGVIPSSFYPPGSPEILLGLITAQLLPLTKPASFLQNQLTRKLQP